jgi:hypothetical protein
MNTIEEAIDLKISTTDQLSTEELDAVVAGEKTLVGAFVSGFLATCPDAGEHSFAKLYAGCF